MPRVTHIRDANGDVAITRGKSTRTYRDIAPAPCLRLTPEEVHRLELMSWRARRG